MKNLIIAVLIILSSSSFAATKSQLHGLWEISDIRCENGYPVNEEARLRHWKTVARNQYRFYDNSAGDYQSLIYTPNGCDVRDYGHYRIANSILYLSVNQSTSRRCGDSKQKGVQSIEFSINQQNELLIYEDVGFSTNDLCYGKARSVLVFKLIKRHLYFVF